MENERGGPRKGGRSESGPRGRGGSDRSKPRGGGRERGSSDGGFYRVLSELPKLEKALSKADFASQKTVLREVVSALKPLRVGSLEQLDLNTRGRLMTTLLRVQRQTKPAPPPPEVVESAPAAPSEVPTSEAEVSVEATEEASTSTEPVAAPEESAAASEPAPPEVTAKQEPAPIAAKADDPVALYADVLSLVGSAWRAVGEGERAETAFAASGKPPPAVEPETARTSSGRPDRPARPPKGRASKEPGPRERRGQKKGERSFQKSEAIVERSDWAAQCRELEEKGRTRDAARLYEKHKSYGEAARLFEVGADLKGALRAAVLGGDRPTAERLMGGLKPEDWGPVLEQAGAYEWLMQLHIARNDFGNVARLYERAKQFDQAGLAWERAGKFAQARRAYERARDTTNVQRLRALEIEQKVSQGDRLGAALLLIGSGEKDKAIEVLAGLPAPKAFRFLKRAQLEEAAVALAERELEKARTEGKTFAQARWLEDLGRTREAAEAWEVSGRKDRAVPLYETLSEWAKAAGCAESAGLRERAIGLFRKAGDEGSAQRVLASPVSAPPVLPEDPEPPAEPESGQAPASPHG